MAIYSLCLPTTVATITTPSWDVKASASNEPAVMELGIMNGAATACTYGYGRSGNTPTQSSITLVVPEDEGRATGLTGCAVSWSVAPTVPAAYFRRAYLPATIGAGIIFTFPRGIVLAAGGASLVQWNIAASTAAATVHVVVDE
jgi:hypothetical protein